MSTPVQSMDVSDDAHLVGMAVLPEAVHPDADGPWLLLTTAKVTLRLMPCLLACTMPLLLVLLLAVTGDLYKIIVSLPMTFSITIPCSHHQSVACCSCRLRNPPKVVHPRAS